MQDAPVRQSIPRYTLLRWALISEGILLILALPFLDLNLIEWSLRSAAIGLFAAAPLVFFNLVLFGLLPGASGGDQLHEKFKREVIRPLCGDLNVPVAVAVAVASGIGEELFFRGVLNPLLSDYSNPFIGVLVGSAIFAYVHFIGVAQEYGRIVYYYVLFGLYFSLLAMAGWGLLPVIVCHASYNLMAMLYMRYLEIPKFKKQTNSST